MNEEKKPPPKDELHEPSEQELIRGLLNEREHHKIKKVIKRHKGSKGGRR